MLLLGVPIGIPIALVFVVKAITVPAGVAGFRRGVIVHKQETIPIILIGGLGERPITIDLGIGDLDV